MDFAYTTDLDGLRELVDWWRAARALETVRAGALA
jgi:hypothetical protein